MATTITPTLLATIDLDNGSVVGWLGGNQWETYAWLSPDDREALRMIRDGEYTCLEACVCGDSGADHLGEAVLSPSTHRCVRCDCTMFEPVPPRFVATVVDDVPTVRDNQTGKVIRHQGVWTEAFAADVARDLKLTPGTAHLLTWEAA